MTLQILNNTRELAQTVWGEGWAARLAGTQPAGLSTRSY